MKYSEAEKDKALQDFRFYHSELLAALNGIKRPVAGDQEVADLRRKLLSAKYVCEKMGVEAQTLWEFAQEKRKESEGKVRQFAIAQSAITPVVSRQLRQQIAMVMASLVFILLVYEFPTTMGIAGAIFAGLVAFVALQDVVATFFPTPAIRVARLSAREDVYVEGIYPQGSSEEKDYARGFALERFRMSRSGDIGWLRVR